MSQIRQRALSFMASHHTVTLATVGANGLEVAPFPCAHADDFEFWVLAEPNGARGKALDAATHTAGIFRAAADSEASDMEIRVEGTMVRVEDPAEQAKALSGFLVHRAALPKSLLPAGENRSLAVYRLQPLRAHVTDRSLLKHTATFHFAMAPEVARPARRQRPKVGALRTKKQPAVPRDMPTLPIANGSSKKQEFRPPS